MDPSSWPENLPSNRKRAIEELIHGRDWTNQLRMMLGNSIVKADPSVSMDDLVSKILGTFTSTLSILNSCDSNEASRTPATAGSAPGSWDGRKSEDSGESMKTSALKNRRGCYQRRKTTDSVTRVTSALIDDGYAWRKYGQKEILNAKHQRNYYRCTHKSDQGCQATKQVQQTSDDPLEFTTTYHCHHTCRNLLKDPQIILDDSPNSKDSSILLSFDTKGLVDQTKQEIPYYPSMKQEFKDDFPCNLKQDQYSGSSADYLVYQDLLGFNPSGLTMSSYGSDHGDVISSGGVFVFGEHT